MLPGGAEPDRPRLNVVLPATISAIRNTTVVVDAQGMIFGLPEPTIDLTTNIIVTPEVQSLAFGLSEVSVDTVRNVTVRDVVDPWTWTTR